MHKKKIGAWATALFLAAALVLPLGTALAAVGADKGTAGAKVNETVVSFGGYEWWVIGNAKGGVYSKTDSVTLFAKNDDFGQVPFRKMSDTALDGYKEYDGKWYEGNFNVPSDYKDSTLQRKMVDIANTIPLRERNRINPRKLTDGDEMGGEAVDAQKLWPLSQSNGRHDINADVRDSVMDWWLRTQRKPVEGYLIFQNPFTWMLVADYVNFAYSARPALSLNVKSVILSSQASGAESKSAAPLGGFTDVTAPDTTKTGKIKFTFIDDNIKLGNAYISKIENGTATLKYSGATAGKTLSAIIKDSNGAVTYYGRLAENIQEEGEISLLLPTGMNPGTDKMEVFVEDIQGEDYSDFASEPRGVDITEKSMVTVTGGSGAGTYAKGEEVTLKADKPDQGKYFKGWNISPAVTFIEGSTQDETVKFAMLDEDVTAVAEYGTIYPAAAGEDSIWQQGSEDGVTVTSQGDVRKFTGVSVDGMMLDKQHYDMADSTVITLKASFLSTLSVGEHVMRIHFTDGYTEVAFYITAPAAETTQMPAPADEVNPNTGDINSLWAAVCVMIIAAIGFVIIHFVKKAKRNNA